MNVLAILTSTVWGTSATFPEDFFIESLLAARNNARLFIIYRVMKFVSVAVILASGSCIHRRVWYRSPCLLAFAHRLAHIHSGGKRI